MKYIRQQNGLSLVEVLASIFLLALVGTLLMNVFVSTKKNYNEQMTETTNLTDLSLIAKEMTRDFRKSTAMSINNNSVTLNGIVYNVQNNKINRNNVPYNMPIKNFCVMSTKSPNIKTLGCTNVSIPSFNNSEGMFLYIENNEGKKVTTTIYARGN